MGGNALPHVPTRRLNPEEFRRVSADVVRRLGTDLGIRAVPLPAYRQKADFGDLDLIVESDALAPLKPGEWVKVLRDFAERAGYARAFKVNAPTKDDHPVVEQAVFSYDHRNAPEEEAGFQVDFILMRSADVASAVAYYSYNDLGNLIGRIAEKMGFTYGHRGLIYRRVDGTRLIGSVVVSQDTDAVLAFLGFDPARFRAGFDRLQDIFDYVVGGKYFHPAPFLLENRNHASRMRDRKRKTYGGFLRHLESHPDLPVYPHTETKADWLEKAFAFFPDFRARHDAMIAAAAVPNPVRRIFSGDNIKAWTGLRDSREVGLLMERVKKDFDSPEDFAAFVEREGESGVKARVQAVLADAPRASRRLAC